jgi:ribosomal protein L37AE/L43A
MTVIPAGAVQGPQCPACKAPLDAGSLHSGVMQCPWCRRTFEAAVFQPREMHHALVQVVTETPEGIAAACANHARNAAVTNCQRCGLFICALCELKVGQETYCPTCFDRMRGEGALEGLARYRDFATMSISAAVIGLLCFTLGAPIGALSVYWAFKGIRQRRNEGRSSAGVIVAMVFGILEILGGLAFVALMIIGMVNKS